MIFLLIMVYPKLWSRWKTSLHSHVKTLLMVTTWIKHSENSFTTYIFFRWPDIFSVFFFFLLISILWNEGDKLGVIIIYLLVILQPSPTLIYNLTQYNKTPLLYLIYVIWLWLLPTTKKRTRFGLGPQ